MAEVDVLVKEGIDLADQRIQQRIRQVEGILDGLAAEVRQVERDAYLHALDLIREIECTGRRLLGNLKTILGESIQIIGQARARLHIPMIGDVTLEVDEFELATPDRNYENIKLSYQRALEAMPEDTPVRSIMGAYANLAELAMATACHYSNSGFGVYFVQESFHFSQELEPWLAVTGIPR